MENAERGPDGEMIIEKIVHVDNSEKMAMMEKALEKEKMMIKKQYEKDKEKIMHQTEMGEEEKKQLMD